MQNRKSCTVMITTFDVYCASITTLTEAMQPTRAPAATKTTMT